MSKKGRTARKDRQRQKKQIAKAAKKRRQVNDPNKWRERQKKKHQKFNDQFDSKFPGVPEECSLPNRYLLPSDQNCKGCELCRIHAYFCPYYPN